MSSNIVEYERFIFYVRYKDGNGNAYVYGDNFYDFMVLVFNSALGYKYDYENSMVFYGGQRVLRMEDLDPNKMYYYRASYDISYLLTGREIVSRGTLLNNCVVEVISTSVKVLSDDMVLITVPITDLATGKVEDYNISYYKGQLKDMSEEDKNEMIELGRVLMNRTDYAKFITKENLDISVGDII